MSFQFFHRVSDGFEFFFVRVDFLRLRFDGALELRLGGFLGGLDETFPDDELARLGVVEKGDFTFGFFRVFEAFLLFVVYYCRLVVSSIRCHHSRESNIKRSKKRAGKSNPKNASSKMENEMTTTTPIYTIYLFRGHQGLELVRFASQTTERAYLLLVFPRDLDVVVCCRPPRRHLLDT